MGIPVFWLKLAALALCLALVGYAGYRIDRNAVERTNTKWQAKVAAAEIKALRAEAERDEAAREIAERTAKDTARRLAEITVEARVTIERIRPLLPDVDTACAIPDGVWDELDAAAERADRAGRDGL